MLNNATLKIAVSGATGFIGKNLTSSLEKDGHKVTPLPSETFNLPEADFIGLIKDHDAIINLAGAPVLSRWTDDYKKKLFSSRIGSTRKIVGAIAALTERPTTFISTSAIGIYTSTGVHTEDNNVLARNFLGDLAMHWEGEALKARPLGVRTVIFRLGVVLGKNGGALKVMLAPFKMGLGGTIGSGAQAFSWVHMEDLKRAYSLALMEPSFEGIFNLTTPNPATNRELTKAVADALGVSAVLTVPSFALKFKYGEGASVLTEGQNVLPKRLLEYGFTFMFSDIQNAVKDCLEV